MSLRWRTDRKSRSVLPCNAIVWFVVQDAIKLTREHAMGETAWCHMLHATPTSNFNNSFLKSNRRPTGLFKTYPTGPSYKHILLGRDNINIFLNVSALKTPAYLLFNFKVGDLHLQSASPAKSRKHVMSQPMATTLVSR